MLLIATEGEDYDLITLDVRMPRLSGCEIFTSVMQSYPHLKERIVFVTGNAGVLKEMLPEHESHVIDKPINYPCFKKSMNAVLDLSGDTLH